MSARDERVRISLAGRDGSVERLWAERVGPDRYRLENSPAFAFGLSLHDVVEAHEDDQGNRWAVRVVVRGPFSTVRVSLDPVRPRSVRLLNMLARLGCPAEGMCAQWFSVSVPDAVTLARLVEELASGGYQWEYANPKRADVTSPHPSAACEPLAPPEVDPRAQAVLHFSAPWRDRADDEVEAIAQTGNGERPELLPARHVEGAWWELCCAPFLVDDLALGDWVEVDTALRMLRVVSRSRRASLRVVVDEGADVAIVESRLMTEGCIVEPRYRGSRVLAVDCASREVFERARGWLSGRENVAFDVVREPTPPG